MSRKLHAMPVALVRQFPGDRGELARELPVGVAHAVLSTVVLALIALALVGCGETTADVYPVAGRLTYEGHPLAGAEVVFHPEPTATATLAPARALTDAAGNFQLTTYQANDGAAAGRYSVTVQFYPLVQQAGDFVPGRNVLPPKYSAPTSTDLKVEVARSENNLPPLDIKR